MLLVTRDSYTESRKVNVLHSIATMLMMLLDVMYNLFHIWHQVRKQLFFFQAQDIHHNSRQEIPSPGCAWLIVKILFPETCTKTQSK